MDLKARQNALAMLSSAVQRWYHHYEVEHDDRTSDVLCKKAIGLHEDADRSGVEIATILIGRFTGTDLIEVDAPTSSSLH